MASHVSAFVRVGQEIINLAAIAHLTVSSDSHGNATAVIVTFTGGQQIRLTGLDATDLIHQLGF